MKASLFLAMIIPFLCCALATAEDGEATEDGALKSINDDRRARMRYLLARNRGKDDKEADARGRPDLSESAYPIDCGNKDKTKPTKFDFETVKKVMDKTQHDKAVERAHKIWNRYKDAGKNVNLVFMCPHACLLYQYGNMDFKCLEYGGYQTLIWWLSDHE